MRRRRRWQAGPTRERLAEMLRDELVRMGISFTYFDGEALEPVTGYWKSQDVYRWESIGLSLIYPETGREMHMSINGWEPMSKIVRAKKVVITQQDRAVFGQYEAWAG